MSSSFEQHRAPFFEAVRRYAMAGVVPYHTPGHKLGRGVDPSFRRAVCENLFGLDASDVVESEELEGDARLALQAAESLAARAFGADSSFFLVNGTTCGIHAMILSTCRPGDTIILARNSHRSAISGVILAGALPRYVEVEFHPELAIPLGVRPDSVAAAFEKWPEARAVLMVHPTYHGFVSDLASVAEIVHSRDKLLLVDEAHGAHFAFHRGLPASAMQAGADMSALGAHKLLGALTQASILLVRHQRVDVSRVRLALSMIVSTSPSHLLYSSLDVARRQMAIHGRELWDEAIRRANEVRAAINEIPGLRCLGDEIIGVGGVAALDPVKLAIYSDPPVPGWGPWANEQLRVRHKVQAEMNDLFTLLALFTWADGEEEAERLVEALSRLAGGARAGWGGPVGRTTRNAERLRRLSFPPIPPQRIAPRDAYFAPKTRLPLRAAKRRVCAEILAPYPPGIPVLCPGEEVTPEVIDYLEAIHQLAPATLAAARREASAVGEPWVEVIS